MKRTLTTAAAMLVGGAGAAGFAAPAGAAGAPELPAELPTDNNSAQTAYHAAATLESAKRSVGDVVPLDEQLTGRSDAQDPLAPITDLVAGTPVGQLAGGAKSEQPLDQLTAPVGEALQGAAEQSGARSGDSTGDALAGGLSGALDGTEIQGAQTSTPKPANPQSGGQAQIGGQDLSGSVEGAVGDLVAPVAEQVPAPEQTQGMPGAEQRTGDAGARTETPLRDMPEPAEAVDQLGDDLQLGRATPAASGLAEEVGGVVQHGPLGGETQFGG